MKKPNSTVASHRKVDTLKKSIHYHLNYSLGKTPGEATAKDYYKAAALALRERLIDAMRETETRYDRADAKRVYYLSMEFLIGRSLENNLVNMGLYDFFKETLAELGQDLDRLKDCEPDAALGNGGLGRLAACFLDSMATLAIPGYGYGINYEFGLFRQKILNGYQKESPDHWLAEGTPWEIERPDEAVAVPVYGYVEETVDREGHYNPMWLGWQMLIGVPHDMPIVGYGGRTVNCLRLYSARSSDEFDMEIFNAGDYIKAVEEKILSETVSKVLYPSDAVEAGRELRLIQEYFLVACAVRDIVRRFLKRHNRFDAFPQKVAIQLNDTHPALTVAELMRLLVDEHGVPWEKAWEITTATLGYTNHTLMPEALEKWPVSLLEKVLPRHLQIIYEINHRFLEQVKVHFPGDVDRLRRMSIIEEGAEKQVRMAYLSIVGSHSVNGVAALHSELVKKTLVPDFYQMWPEKFNNKTNGITQRRWLLTANPHLAHLITDAIGANWITDLDQLRALEAHAEYQTFRQDFLQVKRANKERLADIIRREVRVVVNPDSLFDVQIKRIHEYKRQLLHAMHIIHEYFTIVEDGETLPVPRVHVFAGKAAPGYWAAKQIIKLINNLGQVINNDPRVGDQLKVVFLPDYRVSLAERIFPAADLSEQISTAGMEASGTGNMKFALNGALTIGTLDGANIEIREEVGDDNIFIFGLTADEILELRQRNAYHPRDYYHRDARIRRVMDAFKNDTFCPREPELFRWIFHKILYEGDYYFHLADLGDYIDVQRRVSQEFRDASQWARKAILNVARIGKFSSDRTIREYGEEIWRVEPVPPETSDGDSAR